MREGKKYSANRLDSATMSCGQNTPKTTSALILTTSALNQTIAEVVFLTAFSVDFLAFFGLRGEGIRLRGTRKNEFRSTGSLFVHNDVGVNVL